MIDIGDNGSNGLPFDLAMRPRSLDGDNDAMSIIDFGAYERGRIWRVDETGDAVWLRMAEQHKVRVILDPAPAPTSWDPRLLQVDLL